MIRIPRLSFFDVSHYYCNIMRLQSKISKSVRIPATLQKQIGKKIVRLSLNPVLYSKSNRIVRWERTSQGYIPPQEVILKAKRQYPRSSLSAAVESVLDDVLEQHPSSNIVLLISSEEQEQLRRFAKLSVSNK